MRAPVERDVPQPAGAGETRSRPGLLWWALIGLVFVVGLAVRLYDLADPPLDFHPTRQVHSALIARGMLFERDSQIPGWQRELAVMQWRTEGLIEPQVFERLAAWSYRLAGGPDLRLPRLFAILGWMAAAVFVAWLAVEMAGRGGALLALLFFLAWPYGVVASRAFQPEPPLVALIAACLWAAFRWARQGGWGWSLAAGLLAGLAIYVKSVAVFFVGPALAVVVLSCGGLARLRDAKVWAMAALAILPYAAYHVDGVYLRGYLVAQFSDRFFPQMWIDPAFYLRWISNLGRAAPFEIVLLAAVGVFLIYRPLHRAVLLALWGGYLAYGMALPHHISTHDYYHLLLYPTIALGLAGLGEVIAARLGGAGRLARPAAAAIFLAALVINAYNARSALKRFDGAAQARAWEEIGALLGPGASAAALVPDYGVGLKYWGWINPALWLTVDDIEWRKSQGEAVDFQAWFEAQAAGKDFFVVTLFDELERQPGLKDLLFERYPLYRQSPDYLIFDLRSP
jgi:4-amino-4-deoxy-L-arabinose transferase-like glycosyltransferase